jgi:hypothetical protein
MHVWPKDLPGPKAIAPDDRFVWLSGENATGMSLDEVQVGRWAPNAECATGI